MLTQTGPRTVNREDRRARTSRPAVSVVIPCFGHAHLLGAAIESVYSQTHPVAECIVVDDGSPDDVVAAVAAFPDVRLIRQANRGLAAARNAGLVAATGELITFLDADDVLLPNAVADGVAALSDCPECAFAAGAHILVPADGSPPAQARLRRALPPYEAMLRSNFIGMHGAVLYRRAALADAGGFDESLRACEDYDLYLRLLARGQVALHDAPVAEYRQQLGSLSTRAQLMFTTAMTAVRRQAGHARGDARLWAAYNAGLGNARGLYGELILEEARSALRLGPRGWARAVRSIASLARVDGRHYAARFAGAAVRRLRRGRPTPAPDR